jgi:hypothetical protein
MPRSVSAKLSSSNPAIRTLLLCDLVASTQLVGDSNELSRTASEEIIQRLSRGAKLKVIGRTSSSGFAEDARLKRRRASPAPTSSTAPSAGRRGACASARICSRRRPVRHCGRIATTAGSRPSRGPGRDLAGRPAPTTDADTSAGTSGPWAGFARASKRRSARIASTRWIRCRRTSSRSRGWRQVVSQARPHAGKPRRLAKVPYDFKAECAKVRDIPKEDCRP